MANPIYRIFKKKTTLSKSNFKWNQNIQIIKKIVGCFIGGFRVGFLYKNKKQNKNKK